MTSNNNKNKNISKDQNQKHNSPEIVKILLEMKGCEYLTFLWQSDPRLLKAIKHVIKGTACPRGQACLCCVVNLLRDSLGWLGMIGTSCGGIVPLRAVLSRLGVCEKAVNGSQPWSKVQRAPFGPAPAWVGGWVGG